MSHEDFRPIGDAEFRDRLGMSPKAEPKAPAPKPLKPAEIARQAATLCWRISNEEPDPTKWKARIEAAPEELRECLREYLKQKYRAMQHKAKPKQSAAGDAALAALAKRYGQP
jgi:hypothetical protein